MRHSSLVLLFCACFPVGTSNTNRYELDLTTPSLGSDGLTVVVNRLQVEETPQGGGESTTVSKGRVDLWRFDGEPTRTFSAIDGATDKSGAGDLDRLVWREGHLWALTRAGIRRDGVVVGAFNFDEVRASALGAGPDGGVAVAMLGRDYSLRVWREGDAPGAQPLTVTELSGAWPRTTSPTRASLVLSSGPGFGIALSRGSDGLDPVPTLAWVQGAGTTKLDEGTPLAFWSGPTGTHTVLRNLRETDPSVTTDTLFEGYVVHALGTNEQLGFGPNGNPIWTCNAVTFDPAGTLLFLKGRASGFTLEVGPRTLQVPSDGTAPVWQCSVLSDGTNIHVVWLEQGGTGPLPRPRMLRHAWFMNEVLQASHVVDVAPDLLP